MILTDGTKKVEINMYPCKDGDTDYGTDFSYEFFNAGGLEQLDYFTYKVEDVGYCVEQAQNARDGVFDYADSVPGEFELVVKEL